MTAAKTVELQTQIAAKAAEELALNEASFRVGAKTFLDVTTARGTYEQAQIDRVNAIYDYHKASPRSKTRSAVPSAEARDITHG